MHMKAKLYTYQQPRTTAVTQLACVCSVVNGRARSVLLEGCEIPVVAQLDQVSRVNFGDQVLVCETPSGLVVSGRIAAPDEAPAPRFELIEGVCTISCESDLCLKTAHGSVPYKCRWSDFYRRQTDHQSGQWPRKAAGIGHTSLTDVNTFSQTSCPACGSAL